MDEALAFHGLEEVPVDRKIAIRSVMLPLQHGDPCERMILATAELRRLTLLTPDPILRGYPEVTTEW